MTQRLDGSTMKLPADDRPDRCRKHQQEIVLSREAIQEEHAEYDNGQSKDNTQDQQIAFARDLCPLPPALLIFCEDARSRLSRHTCNRGRADLLRWLPWSGCLRRRLVSDRLNLL